MKAPGGIRDEQNHTPQRADYGKDYSCLTVDEDKGRSPQPPIKPGVEPIVVRVVENESRALGAEVGELISFKE
jgi:hypothetical protein